MSLYAYIFSAKKPQNPFFLPQKNNSFYRAKVHIKYEKRKNEAIKLSIKDLKGLWKAA